MDSITHSATVAAILRGPQIGPRHDVLGATHLYKLLQSHDATGGRGL